MNTHKIKDEDNYICREVKKERDLLRKIAYDLAEAIEMELEFPKTGSARSWMRVTLKRYKDYEQNYLK